MKKILKITAVLIVCMLFIGISDADAQYGKKKKKKKKSDDTEYFDESGSFLHKLWYGGGINLGFAGNNAESVFNIGISPMVGYKISEMVSIGPRLVLDYTTRRLSDGFQVYKVNNVDYGGGIFARLKPFRSIFFHTEFALLNESFIAVDGFGYPIIEPDNKLATVRETSENFYIGAGYFSGGNGGFGYEIVLLYNVLAPDDVIDLPIDLRFGFTWNF